MEMMLDIGYDSQGSTNAHGVTRQEKGEGTSVGDPESDQPHLDFCTMGE